MVLRENVRKSRRSPIGLVPLRGTIMSENLEKVATFAACGTTDPAPACGTACGSADPKATPAPACGTACGSADPAPACGSADPASACGSADPAPACGTACGAADTQ